MSNLSEWAQQRERRRRNSLFIPIAVILIGFLTITTFGSVREAIAILAGLCLLVLFLLLILKLQSKSATSVSASVSVHELRSRNLTLPSYFKDGTVIPGKLIWKESRLVWQPARKALNISFEINAQDIVAWKAAKVWSVVISNYYLSIQIKDRADLTEFWVHNLEPITKDAPSGLTQLVLR